MKFAIIGGLQLLMLLLLPSTGQAQYTWITNNGAITITSYSGPGGVIVIPGTINGLPVATIGDWAFYSRHNLTGVTIPNSVTNIGNGAFNSCHVLTNVAIPNSVTNIGYSAFSGCYSLARITIPNSVHSIEDSTFAHCVNLTNATIGNGVTRIERNAFNLCTSLPNITIPGSVTNIADGAFYDCFRLSAITVDPLNPVYSSVDGVLLNQSQNILIRYPQGKAGNYTLPNSVIDISSYAFFRCTNLNNVIIPNQVTSIGDWTFAGCWHLLTVTIGNSVTRIGERAFYDCYELTNVTIPSSVTNIGPHAFTSCNNLGEFSVDASNSFYSSLNGVLFDKNQTTLIRFPGGGTGNYAIPNGVSRIGDNAFDNCYNLTNITIAPGVASIGSNAFGFSSLSSIIIPDSVTNLGNHAFFYCGHLRNAVIGNNLIEMGNSVFEYCTKLTNVTIPNSVIRLGEQAFYHCHNLGSITIGHAVTSIGSNTFGYCTNLTGLTVPNSVTNIGANAFNHCTRLEKVIVGSGVRRIEAEAFYHCPDLRGVYFLGNAPEVDSSLFYNDTFLDVTIYHLPGTTGWSPLFNDRPAMLWNTHMPCGYTIDNGSITIAKYLGADSEIIIPAIMDGLPVTSIGKSAFAFCLNLTNVTIPNSVTNIDSYAFYNSGLETIKIGNSVSNIGYWAFAYCSRLAGIYFQGNAPNLSFDTFHFVNGIVYYLNGTLGWEPVFGGRPTLPWNPQSQANDASFGVKTNRFGFNITGISNLVIVVEACTNLASPIWFPLQTNTLADGMFYFSDPEWTNYASRFYRLRSPD